jgi:hypothetical protein
VLTLLKGIDDGSEVNEGEEHDVELFEAGEDAAEALEPPEEPLQRKGSRPQVPDRLMVRELLTEGIEEVVEQVTATLAERGRLAAAKREPLRKRLKR